MAAQMALTLSASTITYLLGLFPVPILFVAFLLHPFQSQKNHLVHVYPIRRWRPRWFRILQLHKYTHLRLHTLYYFLAFLHPFIPFHPPIFHQQKHFILSLCLCPQAMAAQMADPEALETARKEYIEKGYGKMFQDPKMDAAAKGENLIHMLG